MGLSQSTVPGMSIASFWLAHCRLSERIVIAYFSYIAVLGLACGLGVWQQAVCLGTPLALFALACFETSHGRAATAAAREWLVPAAVLAGYWQMGWFARGHDIRRQRIWLEWDRYLLDGAGLRSSIESGWLPGPAWLEFSYLTLYAIPPVCIGLIYLRHERLRVDRFLSTFALGTLAAYAMLPLIAVESPRTAFPGEDLPAVKTVWRTINVRILDNLDIATSVFPSGHVAVAFSSAFGLFRAMPRARGQFLFFLLCATSVLIATVYGRYHYAADGLASLLICAAAFAALEAHDRLE